MLDARDQRTRRQTLSDRWMMDRDSVAHRRRQRLLATGGAVKGELGTSHTDGPQTPLLRVERPAQYERNPDSFSTPHAS